MRVIFIPNYEKRNPYQRILINFLSKFGVKINFGTERPVFSVFVSILKKGKPDILHIHWQHPFLLGIDIIRTTIKSIIFILELLILKMFGVKVIWTVHNIVNHEKKFENFEFFFTKLLVKFCDRIIVHSCYARKEIIKKYKIDNSKIVIIPHGDYIDWYANTISKEEARRQLQLNMDDIIFLYFGMIRPYKGIYELIEAFKALNVFKTKLLIVGKPINKDLSQEILKRCNGNKNIITFLKFIPDDEVQLYMKAADIVVLPYKEILTSGSVILAMSFGKPIIAPAIGCLPEMLNSKGGILYNSLERNSLITAMKKALNVDLKKMGDYNLQLAKQLSWKEIAIKTYEIYKECLE